MTTTSNASSTNNSSEKAVVDPIKMPKLQIPSSNMAVVNAVATSFALFFGFATIFAAISDFTKSKWTFNLPSIARLFGSNTGPVSQTLIIALISLAASIVALITISKITDASSLKKAWSCIAKIFLGVGILYVVNMVAILIYSLLSLGREISGLQGELWGSNFVSCLIMGAASFAMFYFSNQIAAGKTAVLRIFSFVAIGIASVATALVLIQHLVTFYNKDTTSKSSSYDYSNMLNYFNDEN